MVASAGLMKLRIRYNVSRLIMMGFGGKVLYPYMLFRDSQERVTDKLFRHEMEHVYQIRRKGVFRFYIGYLLLAIRYGYKKHPYEVEANSVEDYQLTPIERSLKDGK